MHTIMNLYVLHITHTHTHTQSCTSDICGMISGGPPLAPEEREVLGGWRPYNIVILIATEQHNAHTRMINDDDLYHTQCHTCTLNGIGIFPLT